MNPDTANTGLDDAPLIETVELTRIVEETTVVDSVSAVVSRGEIVAVVGPSGAGKSSFLRLLNRLDEPTSGTVYVDGEDYRQFSPRILRQRIGLVPQKPSLVPGTVWKNAVRGPKLRGEPVPEERTYELLERLGIADYETRAWASFLGGKPNELH